MEATMSNQVIILIMFIVPGLTLFFIGKQNVIRFFSAGLFTAFTSGIIWQFGSWFGFWHIKEISSPLMLYTFLPVIAMWVLRFTYGRFWKYVLANAIIDLGFAFFLFPWFDQREIISTGPWTSLIVYAINFLHAAIIYVYQVWHERAYKSLQ
jgi:hypothetical protein